MAVHRHQKVKTSLSIKGMDVPVEVHYERRANVRGSIGKRAAILRMPLHCPPAEREKHWAWFKGWLSDNSTAVRQRFAAKTYHTGDILQVGERQYRIHIEETDNKTHSARLRDGTIFLKINTSQTTHQQSIKTLLSRVVGQDFLTEITERVKQLNRLHFRAPLGEVRLKYTSSRWGSCSTKGNINLSTRLLFAPSEVRDYVIIHELAHRLEMNHSPRFWRLVAAAMPDYPRHETWLKTHGATCDF